MSCKAGIYCVNTTQGITIADSGIVPFGSIIRRFGQGVALGGEGIVISGAGYYDVDVTITVTAPTAGNVTATLYLNGVPVTGATATVTAAEDAVVTLPISALVRLTCCNEGVLTVVMSGENVTSYNASVVVKKI